MRKHISSLNLTYPAGGRMVVVRVRDGEMSKQATVVEVLEKFTFVDGIRWAWVSYRIGAGERRCVGVREVVQ